MNGPENVVYIPTLGRPDNLKAIVPSWIEQRIQVRLVVERYEYQEHIKLVRGMGWGKNVIVLSQPLSGRGIGYARNFCIKHAKDTGQSAIIMAEDDLRPAKDSDMVLLLDEVDKPYVLGCGAVRPIHDRFTGGAISKTHGAILCPGGWGFQIFAINVETALRLGNFDAKLHTLGEDLVMAMLGVEAGIPWRVHCDVKMTATGTRYAPGGINVRFSSPEQRRAAEIECWAVMYKRWHDYLSLPEKKPRVSWQKLYNTYIPEWKEYSALHGGSLDLYDNEPIEGEND
jgi:hypothetical protein